MNIPELRKALSFGALRQIDVYFAERLTATMEQHREAVALAAAWVSNAVGEGHVCVNLAEAAGSPLFASESYPGIQAPMLPLWLQQIEASEMVGSPGEIKPLILEGERLYLGRYWQFEQQLAHRLTGMAGTLLSGYDPQTLQQGLQRLFAPSSELDWQKFAAAMALTRLLSVISGGPGTGKTYTITAILALLIEQSNSMGIRLRIGLAAPTGKAAARLTESIRNARADLSVTDEIKQAIPDEASTLHRLLGIRPDSVIPKYHADNPLHLDVLVLDEASMIDLSLMNRVLDALPVTARLIVLGDKDQLASVEAGSVFADLCGTGTAAYSDEFLSRVQQFYSWALPSPGETGDSLSDNRVMLQKSYRFGQNSGIGLLAKAVNVADIEAADNILSGDYEDVAFREIGGRGLQQALSDYAVQAFTPVMQATSAETALEALEKFRILCAVRKGPAGVEQVNQLVRHALAASDLIRAGSEFYQGRPVMVVKNDYQLGLFNGDIGILWPGDNPAAGLRAWFRKPDNRLHSLLPTRLPAHETAFALTVHKSQGSEFATVLLLLPEQESPVLTKELIYTGITRAANKVHLWGTRAMLKYGIQRHVERDSGLAEKLINELMH